MITASLPPAASPDHLTAALRKAGVLGESCVRDVAVERSFDTLLSHIFRLQLHYEDAVGGPEFLILKAGLADRPGGPWKAGREEVAFYSQVAAAMSDHLVPRCFDAHWDADTGGWHLLLEDLTESHLVPRAGRCRRRCSNASASCSRSTISVAANCFPDIPSVIARLDPAIHPLWKRHLAKIDGCPDQVRA
jgi:hypothetical protein